jgi:hypothetical protein
MTLLSWLCGQLGIYPSRNSRRKTSRTPKTRRAPHRFHPSGEALEGRALLAQIGLTVTSLADSGPGTLRAAILTADAGSHSDKFTIGFASAVTGTIELQSSLPILTNGVTIQGPGLSSLTVERAAGFVFNGTIFGIDVGQTVTLSGLTVANGSSGGIGNWGT